MALSKEPVEDSQPLTFTKPRSTPPTDDSGKRSKTILLTVVGLVAIFLVLYMGGSGSGETAARFDTEYEIKVRPSDPSPVNPSPSLPVIDEAAGEDEEPNEPVASPQPPPTPPADVPNPLLSSTEDATGTLHSDLTSVSNLLDNFKIARAQAYERLKVMYGPDHFQNMFFSPEGISRGRLVFQAEGWNSWERFTKKMMMKLLRVQLKKGNDDDDKSNENDLINFIWATGGHSSAAGHGNFFNESYTAVMEQHGKEVFAALGMNLIGRNYAMGGTSSGPELALCAKEIFGQDMDVLSWDFGMTDGSDEATMRLYFRRAALVKSRPACIAFHTNGRTWKKRRDAAKSMDEAGVIGMSSDEEELTKITEAIPDSAGKSESELSEMPAFVKSLKCGSQMEKGDPNCGAEKYTMTTCTGRKFRVSWHPGWKMQASQGIVLFLFLIEVLEDAINELAGSTRDPQVLLDELEAQEKAAFDTFAHAELPDSWRSIFSREEHGLTNEVPMSVLLQGPNICHTARLPADTRYKGILTESSTQTGLDNYDEGVFIDDFNKSPSESDVMPLAYDKSDRQICDVVLNIDHKDYFYVEPKGDRKIVLPNDAEVKEYGSSQPLIGAIAFCYIPCSFGKCNAGDIRPEHVASGEIIKVEVNGEVVDSAASVHTCAFLKSSTSYIWKPNEDGRFEIKATLLDESSYLRLSSIVIF